MKIEIEKLNEALNRKLAQPFNASLKMQIRKHGSAEQYLRATIRTVADVRIRLMDDATDALVAGLDKDEAVEVIE